MNKEDIYRAVYDDLNGGYITGTFDYIENNHNDTWRQIVSKEDEIAVNWDNVSNEQFVFMCNVLKKLIFKGIMLRRQSA